MPKGHLYRGLTPLVFFNLLEFLFQDAIDPLRFLVQAAESSECTHPRRCGGWGNWSGRSLLRRVGSAPLEVLPNGIGKKILQGHAPLRSGNFGLAKKCVGYFDGGLHLNPFSHKYGHGRKKSGRRRRGQDILKPWQ